MKKFLTGFLCLSLTLGAAHPDAAAASQKDSTLRILTSQESRTNEAGYMYYSRIREFPRIYLDASPTASARINNGYQAMYLEEREAQISAYLKELGEFGAEHTQEWAYAFGDEIACERTDTEVISLRAEYWSYTGGAHPNSTYRGVNFRTQTGESLYLSDLLVNDGMSGRKLLALLERKMNEQAAKVVYDPGEIDVYAKRAFEQSDHWYLTDEGLVFFFNPDEIAPYAVGLIEIELPYNELDGLVQIQYLEAGEPIGTIRLNSGQSCMQLLSDALAAIARRFQTDPFGIQEDAE